MVDLFRYREISALLSARVQDSGDTDAHPDRVLLNGYAMLTPNYRGGSVVFSEAGEYAIPRSLSARVVDGHLMTEVLDGDDSVLQPLFLPVTAGDERQNQEWSWTLTFTSLTLGQWGEDIDHPPLSFPVPDGEGPLELSSVATSVARTANFITRGAPGAGLQDITAANGEIVFSWDNGNTTTIGVPDAVPGRDGEPGEDGGTGPRGERGPQGIQGPAGAGDGFPLTAGYTESPADLLLETAVYRLGASYPKAANGWPAALEGMNAAVTIIQIWSGLSYQEVRGWSSTDTTPAYHRWVRTGANGTTEWRTDAEDLPYASAAQGGLMSSNDKIRLDRAFQQRIPPTPPVDLNGLTEPGNYTYNSASYANAENNFPPGAHDYPASVDVRAVGGSASWIVQEIKTVPPLHTKPRQFYRHNRGGWGDWQEVAIVGELPNSPDRHGAAGDGTTDDTEAIQAWLDSIPERGAGTLPPGTYRITDTVHVTGHTRINGAGGVLFIDGDFTGIAAPDEDYDVELDGLHLRGTLGTSPATLAAQRGLQLNNSGHVRLSNCHFTDFHEICVRIHNAETWSVTDSTFRNYGYCGVAVYTDGIGGTFRGNLMEGTGVYPAYSNNTYAFTATHLNDTYRPSRIIVQGNVIRDQAWEALDTHGGTEIIFDSNIIQNAEAGIVATPRTEVADSSPSSIIISSNVIDAGSYPTPRQGLSIAGSNASGTTVKATGLVIGNTVRGYGRRDGGTAYFTGAMHMTRAEYVTITGNEIISPFGAACRFRAADNCVFSGNTVRNIVSEPGVEVPRRVAQAEGDVSLTMQNNTVIDTPDFVPLYQNTGQATGTVTARGDGNSWDDLPSIASA